MNCKKKKTIYLLSLELEAFYEYDLRQF